MSDEIQVGDVVALAIPEGIKLPDLKDQSLIVVTDVDKHTFSGIKIIGTYAPIQTSVCSKVDYFVVSPSVVRSCLHEFTTLQRNRLPIHHEISVKRYGGVTRHTITVDKEADALCSRVCSYNGNTNVTDKKLNECLLFHAELMNIAVDNLNPINVRCRLCQVAVPCADTQEIEMPKEEPKTSLCDCGVCYLAKRWEEHLRRIASETAVIREENKTDMFNMLNSISNYINTKQQQSQKSNDVIADTPTAVTDSCKGILWKPYEGGWTTAGEMTSRHISNVVQMLRKEDDAASPPATPRPYSNAFYIELFTKELLARSKAKE